ncbi:MAG: carboxymuconolactone decarboxylase family protein [Sutterellaceae bacterium]|nr:carboxymuconolactone decarboxylase family protein [Sutterellaceae bacterium]
MPSDRANAYHERLFPGYVSKFPDTDPEFIDRFDTFAFDDVVQTVKLPEPQRWRIVLALLLGCQGIDEFRAILPAALEMGVTPVEAKEIVYQSVAYLGVGRVYPYLKAVNEIFAARGIKLPLEPQEKNTTENRYETGEALIVEIFGDSMKGFAQSGPEKTRHIRRWLTENCFGDYYARGGLSLAERELMTFCFLLAQGGCESQLASHVVGNLRMGNSEELLIAAVSQAVPFIGYPRVLNALAMIEKGVEAHAK